MTSRIGASRELVLAALRAGELRTSTTGKLSAPVIHVEPGDPWAEPVYMGGRSSGRRLVRWRLTAVAGRVDSEGAYATLGELVDAVDAALLAVPGLELPSWAKPGDYLIDGVPYAAAVATIQHTA